MLSGREYWVQLGEDDFTALIEKVANGEGVVKIRAVHPDAPAESNKFTWLAIPLIEAVQE